MPTPRPFRLIVSDATRSPAEGKDEAVTFSAIFERYAGYVARLAYRLSGRDGETDDVVQEVFFLCARRLHKIQTMEAAKPWLATVTVRVARRMLRRRRLWKILHLSFDSLVDEPAWHGLGPEERELAGRVYRVLDGVPAQHRLAWSLRHLEGESLENVASLCQCSLATAKRWIASAQRAVSAEFSGGSDETL